MPAEISGFVYDAARGRYFRVQENHLNTQHVALRSAPEVGTGSRSGPDNAAGVFAAADGTGVGARYTREVVEGQKRARDEERKKKAKGRRRQRDSDSRTVQAEQQRRRSGRRLAGEIELQLRLRGTVGGKIGTSSVEEMIKQRYATSLSARTVASSVHTAGGAVSAFVVDPVTKELFTAMRLGPDNRRQFCVSRFAEDAAAATLGGADECADGACDPSGWDVERTIPILDTSPLEAVSVVADGCAVWVTQTRYHQPGHDDVDGSLLHVSTRYASRAVDVPWANWREDFGEWGTRTYTLTDRTVWDVQGNPARDGKVVLATSDGVMVWEMNAEDDFIATGREREAMCVAWMNERLWLAGARNGTVQLGDVRDPAATVMRLRHAGAVRAVQGLEPRCDWGLLVWGLEDSAVYDLRWTKPAKEQDSHNSRQTPKKKKKGKAEIPLTRPLLDFEMPESRKQRQYGMGFALDAEAGVVAAAWPALLGNSHVGLWDVTTGRILEGALKDRKFRNYVKSIQFVDLEGRGDGPKSLLVGTTLRTRDGRAKAVIEAWEP